MFFCGEQQIIEKEKFVKLVKSEIKFRTKKT